MIRNFKHKGLERFFRQSDHRAIPAQSGARIERMLDTLDAATRAEEMDVPGYKFHRLKGNRVGFCSVSVTGNWRITFAFAGEHAIDVNLEDYH
ncbi:MAG: Killer protein [Betaproteobacteria bacterium]|nr:MAG: Killer protein [Betaproteobacteria bacterium]TMH00998.1 MAG: Killer protein [Betaproteobacteria bacterium]